MKIPALLLTVFISFSAHTQVLKADFYAGIANYQGDLQTKRFDLNQSQATLGLGITYSITDKIMVRGAANYLKIKGADEIKTVVKDQVIRNLSFKSSIWEAQIAAEYNFLDIDERGFSPYVFGGIAVFHFSPYAYDSAGNKVFLRSLSTEGQGLPQYPEKKQYKNNQLSIPFGGGLKLALTDNLQIGLELGLRKLFTDYLDDVSGTYADSATLANARGPLAAAFAYRGREIAGAAGYPAAGSIRGNPKNKDWYFTTVFRVSYIFGGNNGSGRNKSKTGCPTNVY